MSNDPVLTPLALLWGLPDNMGGQFLGVMYSMAVLLAAGLVFGFGSTRRDA